MKEGEIITYRINGVLHKSVCHITTPKIIKIKIDKKVKEKINNWEILGYKDEISFLNAPIKEVKNKARKAIYIGVRNKTIKKEPCCICGNKKSEAHHENYYIPLRVAWLCKKHHVEADKERRLNEAKIKSGNKRK